MIMSSRKLAASFFCVFLLGVVSGGLIIYDLLPSRFADFLNRTNDPDYIAQRVSTRLTAQYHLDADEQARIAPATRELGQNLYRIRQTFSHDVLAALDTSHAEIAAQLRPDQRAAYLKDMAGKRRQHVAMLMPSGTPPAPAQ